MTAIAIVGASNNRHKYGNKAVRAYRDQGDTVYPVNPHEKAVEGIPAYATLLDIPKPIDIASFYVHPEVGVQVIEDAARKKVPLVILNPGAESEELLAKAEQLGVPVQMTCSILRIGREPGNY